MDKIAQNKAKLTKIDKVVTSAKANMIAMQAKLDKLDADLIATNNLIEEIKAEIAEREINKQAEIESAFSMAEKGLYAI